MPVETSQLGREDGVAALVLKPSVLGGFERTLQIAAWARRRCYTLCHGVTALPISTTRQLVLCHLALRVGNGLA